MGMSFAAAVNNEFVLLCALSFTSLMLAVLSLMLDAVVLDVDVSIKNSQHIQSLVFIEIKLFMVGRFQLF
jgi:hypothetical protein